MKKFVELDEKEILYISGGNFCEKAGFTLLALVTIELLVKPTCEYVFNKHVNYFFSWSSITPT